MEVEAAPSALLLAVEVAEAEAAPAALRLLVDAVETEASLAALLLLVEVGTACSVLLWQGIGASPSPPLPGEWGS